MRETGELSERYGDRKRYTGRQRPFEFMSIMTSDGTRSLAIGCILRRVCSLGCAVAESL
jgi:hypothetical protein